MDLNVTLRGLVFDRFRTVSEFADAIGWDRNKAARIVNGKQEPNKKDMETLISFFGIQPEHLASIFFGSMFAE